MTARSYLVTFLDPFFFVDAEDEAFLREEGDAGFDDFFAIRVIFNVVRD
jgi:hypothetical protein